MKHLWARNKQIVAEEQGIQELQQAQLRAILRKDHSSMLNTDSWREHVAYTRKHLPQIPTSLDYFICNEADMEMARAFLNQRSIDSQVLGEWDRNKKDGITKWIHVEAIQASKGREGVDSGYTSEVTEQQSRHIKQAVDQYRIRKAPSGISNRARKAVSGPSLRRKRPQSMMDAQQDAVVAQDHGVGLSTANATPALAALKIPGSAMSLWARGSHQSTGDEEETALTRGGGSQDSDVTHANEDERLQIRRPQLNINPPQNKEDLDPGNAATSPAKRVIMLKISPSRLLKIQATKSLTARPSTISTHEVLTPPGMTSIRKVINNKPRDNSSQPMPAARMPLTLQDQGKRDAFLLGLLETQRRAAGLHTPPTFPAPLSEHSNRQIATSSKRLRLSPPQESIASQLSNNTQMHTPYGSTQLQRKDSASSQEAPPWSPITQRSNSFSRLPSRNKSSGNESQPEDLPSISSPGKTIPLSPTIATTSKIPETPQTPPYPKIDHVKPGIAQNGSPVLALTSKLPKSPAHLFELPQTSGRLSSHLGTPFREPNFVAHASTDPLRTYGSGLLGKWPSGSQYSPPRPPIQDLAGSIPTTSTSAQDAGQTTTEALLSSFQKNPHMTEKNLDNGGRVPSAEKASEALVATSTALQESETKIGKDSNARPRTYRKSEKQTQKELVNAAAKAGLGKAESNGMKRTAERKKTDAKGNVPPVAKYASQTATHIGTPPRESEHVNENRLFVGGQEVVDTRTNELVEDLDSLGESTIELLEVVTTSKQTLFESGGLKVAQKVKKVASDDESYVEDETSDASMAAKPMAAKPIATPKGKELAVDRAKAAVQGYQTVMAMRGKSALTVMASKSRKAQKATLKMALASDNGEGPAPVKWRKKKSAPLTGELSVQNAEGEGKTKSFRGNQYLNADRTPRVKESATSGQ